jgi:DNA-binding protein Fis
MSPEASNKIRTAVTYAFAEVSVEQAGVVRDAMIDALDRQLITLALRINQGNRLQAARLLGLNRNTLLKRIRALGLDA